jgi:hypothetical protein
MLPEAGRNGNEGCCGSMPSEPVPSELKCSASAIWSTLRPWRCDICLKFSSTSPISSLEALVEESNQKNEKAEKVIFIYGTTFKKNESGRDFQQVQIWNDRSQKQKKNYGSHPLSGKLFTPRPPAHVQRVLIICKGLCPRQRFSHPFSW